MARLITAPGRGKSQANGQSGKFKVKSSVAMGSAKSFGSYGHGPGGTTGGQRLKGSFGKGARHGDTPGLIS